MANELGLGINFDIGGIVSTIGTYIMFGIIIVAVLLIIIVVYVQFFTFKHKIRIKNLVGEGQKLIEDDVFKIVRDRDGLSWYRLRGRKILLPIAPPDCIDPTTSGKISLVVYHTEDGEYIYAKDATTNNHIKNESPFPTTQRALLVNQVRKGEEEKGFRWKDQIPMIAGIAMVILVFLMVFIFWEDITRPSVEVSQSLAEVSANLADIAKSFSDTANQIQTIVQTNSSAVRIPGGVPN